MSPREYLVDSAHDPNAVREALADVYVPRRVTGDPGSEIPVGDLDRSRFVVALQNHDQVGNRADGSRIDSLSSIDAQLAAATLVLLGPMVPLVFQGEEWASSSPFPFFAATMVSSPERCPTVDARSSPTTTGAT